MSLTDEETRYLLALLCKYPALYFKNNDYFKVLERATAIESLLSKMEKYAKRIITKEDIIETMTELITVAVKERLKIITSNNTNYKPMIWFYSDILQFISFIKFVDVETFKNDLDISSFCESFMRQLLLDKSYKYYGEEFVAVAEVNSSNSTFLVSPAVIEDQKQNKKGRHERYAESPKPAEPPRNIPVGNEQDQPTVDKIIENFGTFIINEMKLIRKADTIMRLRKKIIAEIFSAQESERTEEQTQQSDL